jgi:serine/threonine protein kinase
VFWTPTGIATIVMDLVLGMRFIHSRGAIHRNLKPSNLFITDDGHLRIGDLTWCRFSSGHCELTQQPDSAHYQAPEIYKSVKYDKQVDVFSFASILYEILSNHPVFSPDLTPQEVMLQLGNREFPVVPSDWHPTVKNLLSRCWSQDPARRPPFDKIAFSLAECAFQILPGVAKQDVQAFVDMVDKAEPEPGKR